MSKEEKIVFSEEIDSSISGFAVGVSFVIVGLYIWYDGLLHNKTVEGIITIVLLLVGIAGTFLEIERANHKNIKGITNFAFGLCFSVGAVLVIRKFDMVILNIICIFILLLCTFSTVKGMLEIGYSLKIQSRKTKNKKVEIFKVITGLTEIIALIVVVLQLIMEVK